MARGLDHIVIVAHSLDALSDVYKRLGFTVGARNTHPWGTQNHIVQFPGCFLELVSTAADFVPPAPTAPEAGFALGVANYLKRREGPAMLVLESQDAKADHAAFKAKGIGTGEIFWFGRKGKRPDGSVVELAFSVAFTQSPQIKGQGFFVCEQHHPENFWNPAFQTHDNGITGIEAVVIQAAKPDDCMEFLQALSGTTSSHPITAGRAIDLGRGRLEVVTEAGVRALAGNAAPDDLGSEPSFAAIRFASRDLDVTRKALDNSGISFTELNGRLVVAPQATLGTAVVFEQPN